MPTETLLLKETEDTMASAPEGSREIVAIKERLASTKAQVESVSKRLAKAKATKKQMVETLTEDIDDAQSQLLSLQNEVKKVTESLKAAEERHEVVTIDSDSEDEEGNSKKKMKVSTEEVSKDDDTDGEENNNNQIVVMGCGSTEVNGTYKGRETTCNGGYIYEKQGMWKGKEGRYLLYTYEDCWRGSWGGWVITFWPDSGSLHKSSETERGMRKIMMYRVLTVLSDRSLPPENGWMVANGASPPPTLQLQNA